MECPKCKHVQIFAGTECERCGVVFARLEPTSARPGAPAAAARLAVGRGPEGAAACIGAVAANLLRRRLAGVRERLGQV